MPSASLSLPQETTRGSLQSVVLQLRFINKDIRCFLDDDDDDDDGDDDDDDHRKG